jgi:hypothetical protein
MLPIQAGCDKRKLVCGTRQLSGHATIEERSAVKSAALLKPKYLKFTSLQPPSRVTVSVLGSNCNYGVCIVLSPVTL